MEEQGSQSIPQPVVVHPVRLADLILDLALSRNVSTNLIYCADQATFIHDLLASCHAWEQAERQEPTSTGAATTTSEHDDGNQRGEHAQPPKHPLRVRTLRLDDESRFVTVAFCPHYSALLAYLNMFPLYDSQIATPEDAASDRGPPKLVLVNAVGVHRGTPHFSAQGLGRIYAMAVEASVRSGRRLIVAECFDVGQRDSSSGGPDLETMDVDDGAAAAAEEEEGEGASRGAATAEQRDLWMEEVPVLASSTNNHGHTLRSVVGRTVPIMYVAQQWLQFRDSNNVL